MAVTIKIIGAGLAGCEAAWQLAQSGVAVNLSECKPDVLSPAHSSNNFAELVCSNSLRADSLYNAVGLLKEEMRQLNSLIIDSADKTRVPAGGALAVDREGFSALVTKRIKNHPLITVIHEEVTSIDTGPITLIAAGPLATDALSNEIIQLTAQDKLFFYDASAPIVTLESVDMNIAFSGARYDKGGDDYINLPMTKQEYEVFYHELINAKTAPLHENVDNPKIFEGCMPVEVMAKRGIDTLRYGPLKPIGIAVPDGMRKPYAVVQLRQDNADGTLYNMVGFQTRLTFAEQKRVFSLIPALSDADFVRFGVMHRNTYIKSPELLTSSFNMRKYPNVYFAGQITGVEGYVESAASGLMAGLQIAQRIKGEDTITFPRFTALGALAYYISDQSVTNFQPMNINYGIISPLEIRIRDKTKKAEMIASRSLEWLNNTF